jgi:hypothetical protein
LQEFPADLSRFWIACDPDDLLLDERVLHDLRERGFEVLPVRRQGFWDNRRFELTEALAHQDCDFRLPLLDEASGAV